MGEIDSAMAEQACAAVCTRFFHYLDRGQHDRVSGLMAAGGVWNRGGTELRGADAVMHALSARKVGRTTRHLLSNVVVDVLDATTSRVSYELSVFVQDGTDPARHSTLMTGEDRLEHDGTSWRIRRKDARPLFKFDN